MKFSVVVLAAGISSRMQGKHKLLLPVGKEPAVRRTVRMLLGADPEELVVVTGFNCGAVITALDDLSIKFQLNPRYEDGQMTSVSAGVAVLSAPCDAIMICLADQVLLCERDYIELADAFATMPSGSILVPRFNGQRGNPVMFSTSYIPEIIAGQRNLGCRKLIADNPEEVFVYEASHDRFTTDMDTPEDYAHVLSRLGVLTEAVLT